MSSTGRLKPESLWRFFESLSAIPRTSKHEQAAVRFVMESAAAKGLTAVTDGAGSVLVRKPAAAGRETAPTVILQCHLDMVPQKHGTVTHDFLTDPILPVTDGEWVRSSKATTLGADNGIGVAAALAVLADAKPAHGPIEALFTVDEETSMAGAFGLAPDLLTGRTLINLDSENAAELCVGCAGGLDLAATLPLVREPVPDDHFCHRIHLSGLIGGHSGIDIHRGRANAARLLNRFLHGLAGSIDLRLCSFTAGSARNAIPREAIALAVIPTATEADLRNQAKAFVRKLRNELSSTDPGVTISVTPGPRQESVWQMRCQTALFTALSRCPNGVIRMSKAFPGIVETSANTGIVECGGGQVVVQCLLRSSVESEKKVLGAAAQAAFAEAGFSVELSGSYPGWDPDPDSAILALMKSAYRELYGEDPGVKVVHAGLETGIIGARYPGMDMVSCGPTIEGAHSPDERVHIKSVERFYRLLVRTLEMIGSETK